MANIGSLIKEALPARSVALLQAAGALAASAAPGGARRAYLVGGPVRDVLLGIQPGDIDLTIAGDGVAFAHALAAEAGAEVAAASQFGTVKLTLGNLTADIASARRETYASPGALPTVSPGSLQEDLARRDFTVNAMAIDITPAGWGKLIDEHGGQRDIVLRRLRTLHERSFADDPTRIFRALRYEAHLGFAIAPRTLEQLDRHLHYLDCVSGSRVRAELERILEQPERHAILAAAEARGVLAAVHPALRVPTRIIDAMKSGQEAGEQRETLFHVALIGASLTADEADAVIARLEPPSDWADVLRAGAEFQAVGRLLERPDLRRSEVFGMLCPFPRAALEAQLALAPPTARRDRLQAYVSEMQFVQPESRGVDLIAAGVPEGPLVGQLLSELLTARLDYAVRSKDEELALVKRRLPMLLGRSGADA